MNIITNNLDRHEAQYVKNIVANSKDLLEVYNAIKTLGLDDSLIHLGSNHVSVLDTKTGHETVKIVTP